MIIRDKVDFSQISYLCYYNSFSSINVPLIFMNDWHKRTLHSLCILNTHVLKLSILTRRQSNKMTKSATAKSSRGKKSVSENNERERESLSKLKYQRKKKETRSEKRGRAIGNFYRKLKDQRKKRRERSFWWKLENWKTNETKEEAKEKNGEKSRNGEEYGKKE